MKQWICLTCKEHPRTEPAMKLLDNTYASDFCMSTTCRKAKRLFHLEDTDAPRTNRP